MAVLGRHTRIVFTRAAPVVMLALAGCSRSRAVADTIPAPVDASSTVIPAGSAAGELLDASRVADASVSPTAELRTPGNDAHTWSLETTGLPATSADGTQVLMVVESDPDQRGYPHDTFTVRRVKDDVQVSQLLGFDAYELGSNDDSAARPAILRRSAALHALLAREAWTPMSAATPAGANTFTLGDLRFTLSGDHAVLTQKGAPLATFDTSTWRRPDIVPDSMSSSTCVFTPELTRVHIDAKAHVLAVAVRQRVKDVEHTSGCLGPDDTHALHW